MSFLASYEKDSSAINELCRTCLCKTNDEYISIEAIMPWSQRESCSAQEIIEQIVNREVQFTIFFVIINVLIQNSLHFS